MKLKEIITCLEKFAPPALQESYDNAGLIAGSPDSEISSALLCLDCTEEVMDEAIAAQCNLVIAHHPIIFSGLKKITGTSYIERVIIKAIENKIAIYAAHTNLDNMRNGVNARICERLGLHSTQILLPLKNQLVKLFTFVPENYASAVRDALFQAGAGSIGNYDECSFNMEGYGSFRGNERTDPFAGEKGIRHREMETKIEVVFPEWLTKNVVAALKQSHPYEEVAYDLVILGNEWEHAGAGMVGVLEKEMEFVDFLAFLKEKMDLKIIRHTAPVKRINIQGTISRVAVCGGAGSFLLKHAIANNADIFITADFKYHQFFDAENKIIIADIGHYESEQFTQEIFADVLRQNFPNFAFRITSVNTNPIKYY
ncbi:MAG: Nif3-like dinuclear metal center hexameric protein [Chitinophagales bacterium]|nr:Nif3-like dinuclear metal center hexameric protein [Chitinophagales bacterium]